MISRFLEYIEVEKRYSENTLKSYKKDLEDFSLFLSSKEENCDLKLVNKKTVRDFIVERSKAGLSKRSINRKLSSLRTFYVFLLKIEEIQTSPLENIQSLKFYPEKQIPFSEEEMKNLNVFFKEDNILEKLIIETLYQTGIRKAELCTLLDCNVNIQKREILILGKGKKERIIPISERLVLDLEEYSQNRGLDFGNQPFFFLKKNGKKLDGKFVYSVVNKYLSIVSTKQKRSPHILRHSFATHVLNNGAEISKVKKIMGHSSLASTQVYTSADIQKLKKKFNQAHPRGDKKSKL